MFDANYNKIHLPRIKENLENNSFLNFIVIFAYT